jgi:hypothetical protein
VTAKRAERQPKGQSGSQKGRVAAKRAEWQPKGHNETKIRREWHSEGLKDKPKGRGMKTKRAEHNAQAQIKVSTQLVDFYKISNFAQPHRICVRRREIIVRGQS